jgi:hypothetical protein
MPNKELKQKNKKSLTFNYYLAGQRKEDGAKKAAER